MDQKKAIVLGGTVPHIELIQQLKNRGYYTILIDYFDNPPAKSFADRHIQESTLDLEKCLSITRSLNANLVISGCVDQANITSCYVSELLGLPRPYSYQTAKNITNKGYMKRVMMENHIPTSAFYYIENSFEIEGIDLKYPVMVKPADSNSANGVKLAVDKESMKHYLKKAIEISRNKKAIVEEYVKGPEISAYCIIRNKKAQLVMTAERLSVYDRDDQVIKCYSTIAPARISQKAKSKAEQVATDIARVFDLDNTPLFFQAIVQGDDLNVIEFAPRVAGGISFRTIKENTGYDMISAVIDSYLGKKLSGVFHRPQHILTVNMVYGLDGIFDHMTGYEELIKQGIITDFYFLKTKGSVIDNSRASSSRLAAFIVCADSIEDSRRKVNTAFNHLNAFDSQGNIMIRRELGMHRLLDK
jgi:biotin carboxylase